MNEHLAMLEQARSTVLDLAIKFGPRLFIAVVVLVTGVFVGRWLGRMVDRMLRRLELDLPIRQLMVRVVRVLVLALFGIIALQNLGVELLPLIAGLSVAGAGIALAMQGVLGNMVAGLTIIFTRPFRVGEYVSIVGVEGKVEAIALFNTTLSHWDLSRVVIPNRKIVGEILHNYGKLRQVDVSVGVAYDTDLNRAISTIHEVLQANTRVLKEPAPVIQVALLADSSVNIAVKPWVGVPDYVAATGEINRALLEAFRERRIVIPFPQQEVRILSNAA
ncbi:MAG TPA: mechanosensitive ion channel family protein [Burkholderiales bacterium]|nr:mechanosensitive ion channel family protein [Burkholderiales bacterium]